MTPGEQLRAAAAEIRDAAEAATCRPGRWTADVAGPLSSVAQLGPSHDALTATWRQAIHVDLWSPSTALLVADLLNHNANMWNSRNPADYPTYETLPIAALARAINHPGEPT